MPLAEQLRPRSLEQFVGQTHLVGPGKPLRTAIEKGHQFSFILWGPPGTGKTSLARIYADSLGAVIYELSAVSAGKSDIKKVLGEPVSRPKVLFLDEIHRFNKVQQDFLLPYVETGELILIGATTENPSFEVVSPLLSRLRVFTLEGLKPDEVGAVIERSEIDLKEDAKKWLGRAADGDARQALVILEAAQELYGRVTVESLTEAAQSAHLLYDRAGDEHYNLISAYIKSMRASQPDAALYYLTRMIEAGEDPKFIARRLVIFASEDVGLAQPTALVVAEAVFRAVEIIGLPEAAINLAHGTTYLAQAQKDRSSYNAYHQAKQDVKDHGALPVPQMLRNAPTALMKDLGYGRDYELYTERDLLPDKLKGRRYLDR